MKSSESWKWLKKIFILVGGIAALLAVYSYISTPKVNLVADVQLLPFVPPPSINVRAYMQMAKEANSMWLISVKNNGKRRAEGVRIWFPKKLQVMINKSGVGSDFKTVEEVLELGNLDFEEKIFIQGWSPLDVTEIQTGDIRITHSFGSGAVFQRFFWIQHQKK